MILDNSAEKVPEKYKWLFFYSLPCHEGDSKKFLELIKSNNFKPLKYLSNDYSRESVREYFLGRHNYEAYLKKNFLHMVIPYVINTESKIGDSLNKSLEIEITEFPFVLPFFKFKINERELARKLEILGITDTKLLKNNTIYIHFGFVVDIENEK